MPPANRLLARNPNEPGYALASEEITITLQGEASPAINVAGEANLTINGNAIFGGVAYLWPGSDGTTGQVLTTDGAGNLTWEDVPVPGVKNSIENDGGDLQFVNDEAAPGNNKVYGTDGTGTRGWKDDPDGGSGLTDAIVAVTDSLETWNASGADTLGIVGGTDIQVFVNPATGIVTIAFNGSIPTVPGTKNSIEVNSGDYQLVGDDLTPGNNKLYGTDGSGTKGWYDQPAGGGGGGEPKKVVRALNITPRHDSGCGDLQWRQLDLAQPNRPNVAYLPFFPGEDTFAQFLIPEMPANWNLGTITATFIWMHPDTTTDFDVVWSCSARVTRDDDAVDVDFGTAVNVTDTGGTTHDRYKSASTAAITPSGTAGAGASLFLQVARLGDNAADAMAVDAWLLAVVIEWGVT